MKKNQKELLHIKDVITEIRNSTEILKSQLGSIEEIIHNRLEEITTNSEDKENENNFHFNNCLLVNLTVPYFERDCLNEIPVPNVFPGLIPAFNYS